MKNLKI